MKNKKNTSVVSVNSAEAQRKPPYLQDFTSLKSKIIGGVLCVLCGLLFVGCQESSTVPQKNAPAKLSTTDGLIKYIKPLPGVEDVRQWQNPYGSGLVIETRHYEIYTTMLEPLMLKQVPAFVEAAWQQYQEQIPEPISASHKSRLYLFNTREQWEQFSKTFTGAQWPMYQKIKKGAYFLNDTCVAYNIGRTRTFSVLGHEGWHQFCNKHFKYRLPSWLDEGVAQLFEHSVMQNGRFVFLPAKNYQRIGSLKLAMQRGQLIPLQTLISLNPGQTVLHNESSDAATMAFYAQSYAFVRFLREDNYGKRLGSYYQMMLGAFKGTWPVSPTEAEIAANRNIPLTAQWNSYIAQKLFKIYIGEEIKKIEPEFLVYCGKITYAISVSGY